MEQVSAQAAASPPSTGTFDARSARAWLERSDRGSEDWWRDLAARGAPIVEHAAGSLAQVTFLWQCPVGLAPARVYVSVNSVTNHHQQDPQSLVELPGTDIWYWQTRLPANWRGSYAFIPTGRDELPPALDPDGDPRQLGHRAWWRERARTSQSDPNNPLCPYRSDMGAWLSPLHLPEAPDQSAWTPLDTGRVTPCAPSRTLIEWTSARLGERRKAWLHHARGQDTPSDDLALVLLLDGRRWAESVPIIPVIEEEVARDRLPPAAYLLIDSVDPTARQRDLGCSRDFWEAVQQELLPLIEARLPVTRAPARTLVAGQSLGGLAATYAALHWPERFGAAISSSGSFWWPEIGQVYASTNAGGLRNPNASVWLAGEMARQARSSGPPQRFFLEVGSREGVMIDVNETMAAALRGAGHHVDFRIYEGGHDPLCWRGGLIDGLRALLGNPQELDEEGPHD